MFNLGGDDKEKLKENMEEIKDLVNSGDQERASQVPVGEDLDSEEVVNQIQEQSSNQNTDKENNAETQNPLSDHVDENGTGQDSASQGLGGSNQVSRDLESSNLDESRSVERNKDSEERSTDKTPNQGTGFSSEQASGFEGMNESENSETLFLEVDEFNQVEEMVDEMKYLSRELADLMENLEGGVEEDRRIESEAKDIVDEFDERRKNIEGSIN